MATATKTKPEAPAASTLSKADQKLIDKGHLVDVDDIGPFDADDRRFFTIPVYHFEPNAKGDGIRRRSSGVQIRAERSIYQAAIKRAKEVAKGMNNGESFPPIVSVPTGRPKGRPKTSA